LQAVAKEAKAQDTLVLFIAGHGAMVGQRYYFIPHEFTRSDGKTFEEDVRAQGLPGDELADLVGAVPAELSTMPIDELRLARAAFAVALDARFELG